MLTWDLVARSIEELVALGLDDDTLVVAETRLLDSEDPGFISYEYGICHVRIVDGELGPTLSGDITAAQAALGEAENVVLIRNTGEKFKNLTFSFDSKSFPLNPAANLIYQAIIETTPATTTIVSLEGEYILTSGNIAGFKTAFYDKIIAINNEIISLPV
ncbi:MAG: hypothetical protein JJE55_08335 [Flavobacteriaceae bacterium]|nr:hypothetical protein [Flavobacteriaceae bacterium]